MSKIGWLSWFALGLSCLCLYGCQDYKKEVEAKRLIDQCKKINVGMPYQEVLSLMGEPMSVEEFEKNGKKKVRYYYLSPRVASTFTHCVVDRQTGLVEEAYCGERKGGS
jgi:outer membrane protein assembly factor BamE (lipoprotein component of BamABCDE complex)